MGKMKILKRVLVVLSAVFLTACAGQKSVQKVFWPPSPDLPRIQFLTSFKDSADVAPSGGLSVLKLGSDTQEELIPIVKPYGVAAAHGKIYVCDTVQAELIIVDLPNKKMSRLAGNRNAGRLKKPINVAVDAKQNIYVADTSRNEVLQYGPDGAFVRSIGAGKDMKPVDVLVDDLYIYVLDKGSSEIMLFDPASGEYLKSIGANDEPRKRLAGPTNFATDGKGALVVSNFGNGRIVKLDRDGNYLMGYGRLGVNFGEFGRPRGVAVDQDGLVYVADAAAQHVQVFDDKLRLLMFFGGPGTAGSLNIPAGLAVTTDNLDYYQSLAEPGFQLEKVIVAVSQVGERLVSIYGLGKMKGADYEGEYKKALAEQEKREAEAKENRRKALEQREKAGQPAQEQPKGGPAPSGAVPVPGAQ